MVGSFGDVAAGVSAGLHSTVSTPCKSKLSSLTRSSLRVAWWGSMTQDVSSSSSGQARTAGLPGLRARVHAVGLWVTKPRVAVLNWLAEHPHSTAEQVAGAVRAKLGSVSMQAVYNILHCVHRCRAVAANRPGRASGPVREPDRGQPPPPGVPGVRAD